MSFSIETPPQKKNKVTFSGVAKHLDNLGVCSEGTFVFDRKIQLHTADKMIHELHSKIAVLLIPPYQTGAFSTWQWILFL